MGVIIDTTIWVDIERGRLAPADVAARTGEEPVYVTPSVIAELEYGVLRAQTAAQRNRRASAVARIKRKPCLIIDAETGATFGRLAADLDAAGRPHTHRVQDVWIAALAVQHNLKVLTHNRAHFERIPGVAVIAMPTPRREG